MVKNVIGMGNMTDQVIATDFLVAAKSGVQSYAVAITEATTPQVRAVLKSHLNDAITTHDTISNYMIKKGYYHAYDMHEQYRADMKAADTALRLTENR